MPASPLYMSRPPLPTLLFQPVVLIMFAVRHTHTHTHTPNQPTRYRAKLEACLPEVFVSFQATQAAADSRMVQEALRRAVLRLLRVWRDRFIFNDDYINGLQVRLFAGSTGHK